jgi:hypothetical protein
MVNLQTSWQKHVCIKVNGALHPSCEAKGGCQIVGGKAKLPQFWCADVSNSMDWFPAFGPKPISSKHIWFL